jgi:hypothetical protein
MVLVRLPRGTPAPYVSSSPEQTKSPFSNEDKAIDELLTLYKREDDSIDFMETNRPVLHNRARGPLRVVNGNIDDGDEDEDEDLYDGRYETGRATAVTFCRYEQATMVNGGDSRVPNVDDDMTPLNAELLAWSRALREQVELLLGQGGASLIHDTQAHLRAREEELKTKEVGLNTREAALNTREDTLNHKLASHTSALRDLALRERDLTAELESYNRRLRDLVARERIMETAEPELEAEKLALNRGQYRLSGRWDDYEERHSCLEQREMKLQQREMAVSEREEYAGYWKKNFEDWQKDLEEWNDKLKAKYWKLVEWEKMDAKKDEADEDELAAEASVGLVATLLLPFLVILVPFLLIADMGFHGWFTVPAFLCSLKPSQNDIELQQPSNTDVKDPELLVQQPSQKATTCLDWKLILTTLLLIFVRESWWGILVPVFVIVVAALGIVALAGFAVWRMTDSDGAFSEGRARKIERYPVGKTTEAWGWGWGLDGTQTRREGVRAWGSE